MLRNARRKWIISLTVLLGAIWAVGVFLQSETCSKILLAQTRKLGVRLGLNIEFSEGKIELLHGLHFRDLRIVIQRPNLSADLRFPLLDLDYSIGFLSRSVTIGQLTVDHPTIIARIAMADSENSLVKDSTSKPASPIEFLNSPPGSIDVQKLQISHLSLDLKVEKVGRLETGHQELKIADLNMHGQLKLQPRRLQSTGELQISGESYLKDEKRSDSGLEDLLAGFSATGKWQADVLAKGSTIEYSIGLDDLKANATDISLATEKTDSRSNVKIPDVKVSANLDLSGRYPATRAVDKANGLLQIGIEQMALDSEAKNSQGQASRIEVGGQLVKAELEMVDDLTVTMDYRIHSLSLPQLSPRKLSVDFNATAKLDQAISHSDTQIQFKLADLKLFEAEIASKWTPDFKSINAMGNLKFHLNRDLGNWLTPARVLSQTGALEPAIEFKVSKEDDGKISGEVSGKLPEIHWPSVRGPTAVEFALSGAKAANGQVISEMGSVEVANDSLGSWHFENNLDVETGPKTRPETGAEMRGQGKGKLTVLRPPDAKVLPLKIDVPIEFAQNFVSNPKLKKIEFDILAPKLEIINTAVMAGTSLKMSIEQSIPEKSSAFNLHLRQEAVTLDSAHAGQTPFKNISGLEAQADAKLNGETGEFVLKKFLLDLNHAMIQISASGTGQSKSKDAHFETMMKMAIPADFPAIAGQAISGQIEIPTTVTIFGGKEIDAEGHVQLQNFAWQKGDIGASQISGELPFSEKLIYSGQRIHFSELITQNPFERVDFERVRPLLEAAEQLRVGRVTWFEKVYGPFWGFFSVRQNMISAHQFDMDIAAGRMYGELFFNAYPQDLQLGILARLSHLDLMQILPQKFIKNTSAGQKLIGGRAGVVVNLNKSSVDGRIDITEIGGPQLVAMINIMDPTYENEKMNTLRKLLTYGYPTAVALDLQEGYMDMDIELSLLGIAQTENLYGIPVSGFISPAVSEVVQNVQKGPIQ